MSLTADKIVSGIKGIDFEPKFCESKRYKVWQTTITKFTCKRCFDSHEKIFSPENAPPKFPELHDNCACIVVWYEADINYTGGIRNGSRIIYSNDGLMFVTYDHYFTFIEIS